MCRECVETCVQEGLSHWLEALQLLGLITPDVTASNAVMSACAQRGLWPMALELLTTPTVVTYNVLMSASGSAVGFEWLLGGCERTAEWQSALWLPRGECFIRFLSC